MRELIQIPVIHTPEDFGTQREQVERLYVEQYGRQQWDQHVQAITQLWERIEQLTLSLPADMHHVRLYQDGLPEGGHEQKIVEDLARSGNRNHKLLLKLMERGAMLMGTEDIALLLKERERLLEHGGQGADQPIYDELMRHRDEHIAGRIDATLKEDELGLLFIGALHRVTQLLPKDIRVRSLTEQPTSEN